MSRKRRWIVVAAALTMLGDAALAQSAVDGVVDQLRTQGYREFDVSRTLLGRIRVVAVSSEGRREIVFNPATGEILRDYVEAPDEAGTPRIFDPQPDAAEPAPSDLVAAEDAAALNGGQPERPDGSAVPSDEPATEPDRDDPEDPDGDPGGEGQDDVDAGQDADQDGGGRANAGDSGAGAQKDSSGQGSAGSDNGSNSGANDEDRRPGGQGRGQDQGSNGNGGGNGQGRGQGAGDDSNSEGGGSGRSGRGQGSNGNRGPDKGDD